jgi:uncharacterized protein DUF397
MSAEAAGSPGESMSTGTAWRRSSRCDINGSCVEVAMLSTGAVGVRDGKLGSTSPVLAFDPAQWRALVSGIAAGRFDLGY